MVAERKNWRNVDLFLGLSRGTCCREEVGGLWVKVPKETLSNRVKSREFSLAETRPFLHGDRWWGEKRGSSTHGLCHPGVLSAPRSRKLDQLCLNRWRCLLPRLTVRKLWLGGCWCCFSRVKTSILKTSQAFTSRSHCVCCSS